MSEVQEQHRRPNGRSRGPIWEKNFESVSAINSGGSRRRVQCLHCTTTIQAQTDRMIKHITSQCSRVEEQSPGMRAFWLNKTSDKSELHTKKHTKKNKSCCCQEQREKKEHAVRMRMLQNELKTQQFQMNLSKWTAVRQTIQQLRSQLRQEQQEEQVRIELQEDISRLQKLKQVLDQQLDSSVAVEQEQEEEEEQTNLDIIGSI